jgi:hypothetical protein
MLSAPVLGAAVLASSPALYQGFVTQTVSLELAGSRFAVALVISWLAISAVAMLVGEPPKPAEESADGETLNLGAVPDSTPDEAPRAA